MAAPEITLSNHGDGPALRLRRSGVHRQRCHGIVLRLWLLQDALREHCCLLPFDPHGNRQPMLSIRCFTFLCPQVENSSQETVCCCVDLPFSRHTKTFPKYKVIGVVFDEGMKVCCSLPCMDCPPKICYPCCKCCAPVNHTSTFDLRAQQEEKGMFSFLDSMMAGPSKNHPSFTSTEAPDKQAIRAWIFAGIVEKVNQYHCLALLRDADLVERSKPQLTL